MATPMRNARQKAYKNETGYRRDDQELLVSSGRKKDKDKIKLGLYTKHTLSVFINRSKKPKKIFFCISRIRIF